MTNALLGMTFVSSAQPVRTQIPPTQLSSIIYREREALFESGTEGHDA